MFFSVEANLQVFFSCLFISGSNTNTPSLYRCCVWRSHHQSEIPSSSVRDPIISQRPHHVRDPIISQRSHHQSEIPSSVRDPIISQKSHHQSVTPSSSVRDPIIISQRSHHHQSEIPSSVRDPIISQRSYHQSEIRWWDPNNDGFNDATFLCHYLDIQRHLSGRFLCSFVWGERRVWRYQRGNQNPYIDEEQTTQWPRRNIGSVDWACVAYLSFCFEKTLYRTFNMCFLPKE
jgi:hypothetical protein